MTSRVGAFVLVGLLASGCTAPIVPIGIDSTRLMGVTAGDAQPDSPAPVGSCSALGAPNVWQNVTPIPVRTAAPGAYAAGGTSAMVLDPLEAGTVYQGTDNGHGIWKSTDCAATWSHVNTGANGELLDGGRQRTMVIDPTNGALYASSTYGANGLYKSIDGAVDWSVVWPPANDAQASLVGGNVVDAQIDAANHEHLLVNFDLPCGGSPGQGCFAETLDAGATWKVFEGDATTGPFAAGSHVYFLESNAWLLPSGSTYWQTTDSGATWTSVFTGSLTLGGDLAPQSLTRGGDGRYYLGAQLGVLSSTDGMEWSILPGSPQYAAAMPNDGTTLFATTQNSTGVFRSTDGVSWTPMAGSPQGCAFGAYDETDHLLYASCGALGLWRVVTE